MITRSTVEQAREMNKMTPPGIYLDNLLGHEVELIGSGICADTSSLRLVVNNGDWIEIHKPAAFIDKQRFNRDGNTIEIERFTLIRTA